MKIKELKEFLDNKSKEYSDFDEWEVFVEDQRLFTWDNEVIEEMKKMGDGAENTIIQSNNETDKIVKSEEKAGWKFLKGDDSRGGHGYYKEVGGGMGLFEQEKGVAICINY